MKLTPPPRTGRVLTLLAVFAALLLAPTALASAVSHPAPRTWTVRVGAQSGSGAIQGMAYGPTAIWINVGDTVKWTANSLEPHTVSFANAAHPAAPFSPTIAYMVNRTPQSSISSPGQFRNSGIMATMSDPTLPPAHLTYRLTFKGVGTYHYLCYLHGAAMQGVVHVRRAGTPYP
jgi:plastocyanin